MSNVQSPIALSFRETDFIDIAKPLEYHGYWDANRIAHIENTGQSAVITFSVQKQQQQQSTEQQRQLQLPYIKGGLLPLNENYIFEQLHFHWSNSDESGSEHVLDHQR